MEEKNGFKRECAMQYSTQKHLHKTVDSGKVVWGQRILKFEPQSALVISGQPDLFSWRSLL